MLTIGTNRYSKWASIEQIKDTTMSQAFSACQMALANNWDNPMPTYETLGGLKYAGGNLMYQGNRYADLDWPSKVAAYEGLDAFFQACVNNYHVTYNV